MTHRLVLFYISTFLSSTIKIFQRVFELQSGQEIYFKQNKGNDSKSKKARVVILVHDTWSCPVLHFYQVLSKYFKGYLSYAADTKSTSNKTKGNNSKSKKARVVILVHDISSCPVLHFYQVFLPRVFNLQSRQEALHQCRWDLSQKQYVPFPPSVVVVVGGGGHIITGP